MKTRNIIWFTMVFLLVLCIYFIGIGVTKNIEKYQSLEADLKEATNIYIENNNINIPNNDTYKINIDDLIKENLIDMSIDKDTCNGYVIVKNRIQKYEIKPYIRCNNYETEGFKE